MFVIEGMEKVRKVIEENRRRKLRGPSDHYGLRNLVPYFFAEKDILPEEWLLL